MNEMPEITNEGLSEWQRMVKERDEWIWKMWTELKARFGCKFSDSAYRRIICSWMNEASGWDSSWKKLNTGGVRDVIVRKGGAR